MRLFQASAIAAALVSAVSGMPQTAVSVDDLAKGALNAKYGQDAGAIDPDILNEIFGQAPVPASPPGGSGPPEGYVEDDQIDLKVEDTACESYADYGFHCVEYYQCKGGLIIKDGAWLFDIRSNFAHDCTCRLPFTQLIRFYEPKFLCSPRNRLFQGGVSESE